MQNNKSGENMEIVGEKTVGDEVEVQFELSGDEYDMLYEHYLKEKEQKEDSDNYSFDDYFQELVDLIILHHECEIAEKELSEKRKELKEKERILRFKRDELQAKLDGNNS